MVGVIGVFNLFNGINLFVSALQSRLLPMQLIAGMCLALGVVLASMTVSYLRKMHRLKADAMVFEQ